MPVQTIVDQLTALPFVFDWVIKPHNGIYQDVKICVRRTDAVDLVKTTGRELGLDYSHTEPRGAGIYDIYFMTKN